MAGTLNDHWLFDLSDALGTPVKIKNGNVVAKAVKTLKVGPLEVPMQFEVTQQHLGRTGYNFVLRGTGNLGMLVRVTTRETVLVLFDTAKMDNPATHFSSWKPATDEAFLVSAGSAAVLKVTQEKSNGAPRWKAI